MTNNKTGWVKDKLVAEKELKFTPLADIVIIKPDERRKISTGGIHLIGSGIEQLMQGIVLFAGPGRWINDKTLIPTQVKTGDRVLYSKYANLAIRIDDSELICLHEADIVGIME